jgi:hypothetical protein
VATCFVAATLVELDVDVEEDVETVVDDDVEALLASEPPPHAARASTATMLAVRSLTMPTVWGPSGKTHERAGHRWPVP